eukprot:11205177-Lingulodinium_polyedra.AAC.1
MCSSALPRARVRPTCKPPSRSLTSRTAAGASVERRSRDETHEAPPLPTTRRCSRRSGDMWTFEAPRPPRALRSATPPWSGACSWASRPTRQR